MTRNFLLVTAAATALAACTGPATFTVTPNTNTTYPGTQSKAEGTLPVSYAPPDSAYRNVGDPERLLDSSSELVTMSVTSKSDVADVTQMVRRDPPTRAELNCNPGEKICAQLMDFLASRHIPVEMTGSGNNVILIYDRVVARECDSRFVDNSQNAHNLNHPALGCATVANTIQMIGDKRQLTSPGIMDLPDGAKAVQQKRRYAQPPKQSKPKEGSLLKSISTDQ